MSKDSGATARFAYSVLSPESFDATGRRGRNEYRELPLAEATAGRASARVSRLLPDAVVTPGWHYHECEMQLLYCLQGSLRLEVAGEGVFELTEGACYCIPGGLPHNALWRSPDHEGLEITFPAEIGTVPCETAAAVEAATAAFHAVPGHRFSVSVLRDDSFTAKGRRGRNEYRDLQLEEATGGRAGGCVSRVRPGSTVTPAWHYHQCEMQLVYILKGKVRLEVLGEGVLEFGAGSFFHMPGDIYHNALWLSEDHEGLEITLPAAMGTVYEDPDEVGGANRLTGSDAAR